MRPKAEALGYLDAKTPVPRHCLELFEELADRAGDVDSAGDAALAVLDALDDAGGLGALGTVGALLCIHDLFAVAGLANLCHCDDLLGCESLGLARLRRRLLCARRPGLNRDGLGWWAGPNRRVARAVGRVKLFVKFTRFGVQVVSCPLSVRKVGSRGAGIESRKKKNRDHSSFVKRQH